MYVYLGDFPTGATIFFPFHTFDSAGASVTISGLAVTDIEVYKGASMTQRSSDAGYALVDTDGIDLDGVTGIHGFTIDTSDNTDAGFYAAGNDYTVVVSSITVDSQTVNFIVGRFSIDNRGLLRPTTAQRTLDVSSTGAAGLDFNNVELPVGAIPALGIIDNGTLQSGSASGGVLRAGASLGDDVVNGAIMEITGGTGVGQVRVITDFVGATDAFTVSPDWGVTVDNTSTYIVRAAPPAPTASGSIPAVNVTHAAGTAWNSGAITASTVATGAIDADALAADAGTELATAVWANGTRTITALDEDSVTLDLDATIRAAVGMAGADLDTQLAALDDAVLAAIATTDGKVDEIKVNTDKFQNLPTVVSSGTGGQGFGAP